MYENCQSPPYHDAEDRGEAEDRPGGRSAAPGRQHGDRLGQYVVMFQAEEDQAALEARLRAMTAADLLVLWRRYCKLTAAGMRGEDAWLIIYGVREV